MMEVSTAEILWLGLGVLIGGLLGVMTMLVIHLRKVQQIKENSVTATTQLSSIQEQFVHLQKEFKQLQDKYLSADSALQSLAIDKEVLEKEKNLLMDQFGEREKVLDKVEKQMKVEFEALARRSLSQNSIQLSHLHKDSLQIS
ncbi:MAG: hypothetical protein AAFR66_06270 [Bacteroidota bacterium]